MKQFQVERPIENTLTIYVVAARLLPTDVSNDNRASHKYMHRMALYHSTYPRPHPNG